MDQNHNTKGIIQAKKRLELKGIPESGKKSPKADK
jgi:hypothetical protein